MSCLCCFSFRRGYNVAEENRALLLRSNERNKNEDANPADPTAKARAQRDSKVSFKGLINFSSLFNTHKNKLLPFSPQELLDFVNDPEHLIHVSIPTREFVSKGSFTNVNSINSAALIVLKEDKPFIEGQALTEFQFKLNPDNSYTLSYSLTESWSAIPVSADNLTGSFTVLSPEYSESKGAKLYTFTISPPVFEPALGSTNNPPNPITTIALRAIVKDNQYEYC
jgi:hypothetical protein